MSKYVLLLSLFTLGCSDGKICYPSPIIGQEDMCHTEAEWKVISDQNLKDIACMEKEIKGARYGDKKYQNALKKCNFQESESYTTNQIK